jgi:hypothetical protein
MRLIFLKFFRIFLEPGRLDPPLCLIMLCRLPIVFILLSCCAVAKATDDSRSFFEISSDSGCLVEGNILTVILSVAKNTLWKSLDDSFQPGLCYEPSRNVRLWICSQTWSQQFLTYIKLPEFLNITCSDMQQDPLDALFSLSRPRPCSTILLWLWKWPAATWHLGLRPSAYRRTWIHGGSVVKYEPATCLPRIWGNIPGCCDAGAIANCCSQMDSGPWNFDCRMLGLEMMFVGRLSRMPGILRNRSCVLTRLALMRSFWGRRPCVDISLWIGAIYSPTCLSRSRLECHSLELLWLYDSFDIIWPYEAIRSIKLRKASLSNMSQQHVLFFVALSWIECTKRTAGDQCPQRLRETLHGGKLVQPQWLALMSWIYKNIHIHTYIKITWVWDILRLQSSNILSSIAVGQMDGEPAFAVRISLQSIGPSLPKGTVLDSVRCSARHGDIHLVKNVNPGWISPDWLYKGAPTWC